LGQLARALSESLVEAIPSPVFRLLGVGGLAEGRSQAALPCKRLHQHHPPLGVRMNEASPEFHRRRDLAWEVLF
jgi:hypothetical protein